MAESIRTRVYLHDGLGSRIGELTTVRAAARSYELHARPLAGKFTIAESDPLAWELDPRRGRALVIVGRDYPYPWVGKVVRVRQNRSRRELDCTVISYEDVLEHRFLGDFPLLDAAAGEAVRQVLEDVNAANPTGIEAGNVSPALRRFNGTVHRMSAYSAISTIAAVIGAEWWLRYFVTPQRISVFLDMAQYRGSNAYQKATLADGGNMLWDETTTDGRAAAYGLRLYGGKEHALQPANQTPSGAATFSAEAVDAPHGFRKRVGIVTSRPLNRDEFTALVGALNDAQQLETAARLQLGKMVGGVAETISMVALGARNTTFWPLLSPGNVVKVVAPGAFRGGFEGPVRILGVQPDDEARELRLVTEILDIGSASATPGLAR